MPGRFPFRVRSAAASCSCLLFAVLFAAWPPDASALASGRASRGPVQRNSRLATLTVTTTDDSGPGSLRQAILDANGAPGADQIAFALGAGVPSIALTSPLPAITGTLTINGGTGGSTHVELNGAAAGALADGLVVSATGCALRRLVINRFSGNGISVTSTGSCTVETCVIGSDATGTSNLGNGYGIVLRSSGNVVGGPTSAVANIVAFNAKGIVVPPAGPTPLRNSIRRNSIFGNGIGIDLGDDGTTPNDPGDSDSGPNRLLNSVVVGSVTDQGPVLDVHGVLISTPNTDFELEFFVSATCGAGASGDGRTWIATVPVTTSNGGAAIFAVTLISSAGDGNFVTATTHDVDGNTSEFSGCVEIGADLETVGIHDEPGGAWFLKNDNVPGPADLAFGYGPQAAGMRSLAGDWDGDGFATPGLYDPASGAFFLRNSPSPGPADLVFTFGPGGQGWLPVVGDWDGNGTDTPGLYAPTTGAFFLRNANASGASDIVFSFGPPAAGWLPIAGDWDGDHADSIGLYDNSTGAFFLKFANSAGAADRQFSYGPAGLGWLPVAGDYDHNGLDSIGLYDPATATFFLRNANSPGAADDTFQFGPASFGIRPLIGDWDNQ